MKLILHPLSLCLLFAIGTVSSQQHLLERGNHQYDRYEYVNAQKTYLKVVEKGYKSAELFKKLGNSYYYNSEFKEASEWYKQLLSYYTDKVEPEYYYRYAQTLKSKGQYNAADLYMGMFAQLSPQDHRARLFLKRRDYLNKIKNQSGKYEVKNLDFNSSASDFGTAFYGRYIIFSSSRAEDPPSKKIHEWTKEPYLDFYIGSYNQDNGGIFDIEKWQEIFNSDLHESTPVFTKDKQTVYFTRNNQEDSGVHEPVGRHGMITNKLKIYRSYMDKQGQWTTPEPLPFNSDAYSVAHPALSLDENKLYFSSDMPGGEGESDLYEVAILPNGNFGTPKNLGSKINTEGKETFPFISENNNLYFSSDGHVGLGGLDIYVINLDEEKGEEGTVTNIGKPVNSPADDFAFIIDDAAGKGYLSSNRVGGKGKDDIYSFTEIKKETIVPSPCPPCPPCPYPYNIGDDLGKILALNPIYFDFDKSFIRPDAAVELNKVIGVMKEYPTMKIDVRSHTDSRGSFQYNIGLSERRAKSTVNYMVEQGGITPNRLTSKGYSESQLVNHCSDGVYCTKEEHQLNRRSEFIIVE